MSLPTAPESAGTSTRPYLIRALHDWCTDNGYTPYLAVYVDASVRVPVEYVKNREIVLNVGFDATSGLVLGNETVEFKARFGGSPREIVVPVTHIIAIYARENGQGMAFPAPAEAAAATPPSPSPSAVRDAADAPAGPRSAPAASPVPHLSLAGASPPATAAAAAAESSTGSPKAAATPSDAAPPGDDPPEPSPPPPRPALKRIK